MLAPLETERRSAGSRALVLLGAACALSGLVVWGVYEPAPMPAPAMALYVPPTGLQPVAVPGQQTAPVDLPSVGYPGAQAPAAPAAPMASPYSQMPTMVDSPGAQMYMALPSMDTTPQSPSENEALMDSLQGFFWGVFASTAIGVTIAMKRIKDGLQSSGESVNSDMVPRRAGVPTMMADAGESNETTSRRKVLAKALGASILTATAANAEIDYAGVGFLGGSKTIDVNNANIRVYQKLPGMYPNAAGKLVSKAPYKSKEEMYTKANFTSGEAAVVKKYDSQFVFLEPRPEYIIDNINNGLYR